MANVRTWRDVGEGLGRSAAALGRTILWGVLAGGTHLGIMPEGPLGTTTALIAACVVLVSNPVGGGRFLDRGDTDKVVRLGLVTAVATAATLALDVPPSAYVVGCVFFVASKTLRAAPVNVAAVVASVVAFSAAGWLATAPVLLVSGDPWTAGGAARDVLRFVMLAALIAGARGDERREVEVARASDEAVRAERARIARELHDVVAHHVSVMTIQTEAARSQLPPGADRADAAIAAAADSGRTAMTELRRLLGVLRSDDAERGELGPQPGLDDLDALVAEVRAAGVAVDLDVRGGRPAPSGGVALSAYRIVQEAVTNAMKHAPGQPIRIVVDHGPGAVAVEVANDGPPSPAAAAGPGHGHGRGHGHGLIGMRERALLHEGSFRAGPGPDGRGWVVRAELPLDPVPA